MDGLRNSLIFTCYIIISLSATESRFHFTQLLPTNVIYFANFGAEIHCGGQVEPNENTTALWIDQNERIATNITNIRQVFGNGSLIILPFDEKVYRKDLHDTSYKCIIKHKNKIVLKAITKIQPVFKKNFDIDEATTSNNLFIRCIIPANVKFTVKSESPLNYLEQHCFPGVPNTKMQLCEHQLESPESSFSCSISPLSNRQTTLNQTWNLRAIKEDGVIITDKELSYKTVIPCIASRKQTSRYTLYYLFTEMKFPMSNNSSQEYLYSITPHGKEPIISSLACTYEETVMKVKRSTHPLVKLEPRLLVVNLNSEAVLRCTAEGLPKPDSISWYRNGRLLTTLGRPSVIENGEALRIHNVQNSDIGMYQCFVRVDHQVYEASAEIRMGATPPDFLYRFIQQTLTPGPAISLKCIAGGSPTPTISWTLDGFPLPQSDRFLVGQYLSVTGEVVSHVNITNTKVEDGGLYTCEVTNTAGKISHSAALHIYGSPHVRQMGELTAVANDIFKVRCPVAGYPTPAITWKKDGEILPSNVRQRVTGAELEITGLNRDSDEGEYTCMASDKRGHIDSESMYLKVVEAPQVAKFYLPDAVKATSRVAVQCVVAQGDAPVKIEWLYHDKPAQMVPGVTVAPLGEFILALIIKNVGPEHAGNYTCRATSEQIHAVDSYSATLRVHVPPTIKPFNFGDIVEGMRAQAACFVQTGDPPMSVNWVWNNISLTSSHELTIHQMGDFASTLIIHKAESRHSGNYTCIASNDAREIHYSAVLQVKVPPFWKEPPKSVTAVVGQNDVFLTCLAGGLPPPLIRWKRYKDGYGRQTGGDMGLGRVLSNGTLHISPVTEQSAGTFICQATNEVGPEISSKVTLEVFAPPTIQMEENVTVRRNSPTTIKCRASGDPALHVSLVKDGQPLDLPTHNSVLEDQSSRRSQSRHTPVFVKEDPTKRKELKYHLKRVTLDDGGEYKCIATNPYGTEHATTILVVQDIPNAPRDLKVIQEGSRTIQVAWGSPSYTSIIEYFVLEVKKVKDTWDSHTVKRSKLDSKHTSAEVPNLLPSTAYQIRVIAVNNVGESPPSEALTVNTAGEPPGTAPKRVTATPLSSQSIRLTWLPPNQEYWHGQLQGFYIGYKEITDRDNIYKFETVSMKKSQTSYEIKRLKKYQRYSFVVQAFNAYGPGPLSEEVFAMTLEDLPEAPPIALSCNALTSTRLEISWQPPPLEKSNGIITSYSITCVPSDPYTEVMAEKTVISTSKSITIGGLKKYTNYSVTIAAATKIGVGKKSKFIVCSTEEDVPGPPSKIKTIVGGPSKAVVAWLPPNDANGIINKYTIYMQKKYSNEVSKKVAPPHTKWMEISNLPKNTPIKFWMTASTRIGEGPPTRKIEIIPTDKSKAAIFSISREIRAPRGHDVQLPCLHVDSHSAKIKWFRDGNLLPIVGRIKNHFDGILLIQETQKIDKGNYTCVVSNKYGRDEATFSLVVMVPPSSPRLEIITITKDSTTVSWKIGEDGGSPITKLTLTWRAEPGEWQETILLRHLKQYTLDNLSCGTIYRMYITAYNIVGPGSASDMVTVKTKGSLPPSPHSHRVLSANESTVFLRLKPFKDFECQVDQFQVKIKPVNVNQWTIANERVPGISNEYFATGLQPDMSYDVEIQAFSSAGENKVVYTFKTLGDNPNGKIQELSDGQLSAGWGENNQDLLEDPAFIAPVLISIIAVFIIMIAIGFCLKKRPGSLSLSKDDNEKISEKSSKTFLSDEPNSFHKYYGIMRKTPTDNSIRDGSIDTAPEYPEDIRPYATFEPKEHDDTSISSHLPRFYVKGHQRIKATHLPYSGDADMYGKSGRGRSISSSNSDYAQVKRGRNHRREMSFGGDSEGYGGSSYSHQDGSILSDTDTEFAPSIRTDNSSRQDDSQMSTRTAHHNANKAPSTLDRKSMPRKLPNRIGRPAIERNLNRFCHLPSKRKRASDGLELSETECDRDTHLSLYSCDQDFTVAV